LRRRRKAVHTKASRDMTRTNTRNFSNSVTSRLDFTVRNEERSRFVEVDPHPNPIPKRERELVRLYLKGKGNSLDAAISALL
jgi:hypothetical protein